MGETPATPQEQGPTAIVEYVRAIRRKYEDAVNAATAAAHEALGSLPEMVPEEIGLQEDELNGAMRSLFAHIPHFTTVNTRQQSYGGVPFASMAPGSMTIRLIEGENIYNLMYAALIQSKATGHSYYVATGSRQIIVTPEQTPEGLRDTWRNG